MSVTTLAGSATRRDERPAIPPTSSTLGATQLVSPDAMIEIEAVAVIPGPQ